MNINAPHGFPKDQRELGFGFDINVFFGGFWVKKVKRYANLGFERGAGASSTKHPKLVVISGGYLKGDLRQKRSAKLK
jgi:hypothetical protein